MSREESPLTKRMKSYEAAYDMVFPSNMPIIVRVDGKNFSTFTKHIEKPFDDILAFAMQNTMKNMCVETSNCQFGYTQSDEITLVLFTEGLFDNMNLSRFTKTPYEIFEKSVPHNNRITKTNSLFAAMATRLFNKYFRIATHLAFKKEYGLDNGKSSIIYNELSKEEKDMLKEVDTSNWIFKKDVRIYQNNFDMANFDSRMFVIPDFDIVNNIIFRQEDAIKNSISSFARTKLPKDVIHKKNGLELREELDKIGQSWDDLETWKKFGLCTYKTIVTFERNGTTITRKKWYVDKEMPILKDRKTWLIEHII